MISATTAITTAQTITGLNPLSHFGIDLYASVPHFAGLGIPRQGPELASRRENRVRDSRETVPWLHGRAGSVLADGVLATATSHALPGEADLHRAMVLAKG
jgi:hypothetical protein